MCFLLFNLCTSKVIYLTIVMIIFNRIIMNNKKKLNQSINKNTVYEYGLLFGLLVIATLIMFKAYIFEGNPFRWDFANDHVFQVNQFYTEYSKLLTEALKSKAFPFYSWNTFLGNSFYASKVYYLTGDIFLPLLLLFRNNVFGFILTETILCIFISAVGMREYLKNFGIKDKYVRIIFSLVFAVGGCGLSKYCYPMFHRFYAFMPFLFLGTELYLKKNKLSFFAITVCILFLQNYYYMFPTTLFLPFYFIYSCYLKDSEKGFHLLNYLKKAIKLIAAYIVGFLTSMVILLPGIFFILNSSRLTYNELSGMFTWPFSIWLSLYYYLFVPVINLFRENTFGVSLNTDNSLIAFSYSLTVSTLGVLGLFCFYQKRKQDKFIAHVVMSLFLLATNMILPISSIFHMGTTPTMRFTHILGFFLTTYAAKGIDEIDSSKESLKTFTSLVIFTLVIILISIISGIVSIGSDSALLLLMLGSLLLIGIEVFFVKKKLVLTLLVFIELVSYSTYSLSEYVFKDYEDTFSEEEFTYLKQQDEDLLYRTYIHYEDLPPYVRSNLNLNTSMIYGYSGLSTYDTTYENVLDEFITWTQSYIGTKHIIDINNPNVFKLLGVKYVAESEYTPLDSVNQYEYAYNIQYLKMYKITDYNQIGHSFSEFVNKDDIQINPDTFDWNNTLIVDQNLYNRISDIQPANKEQFKVTLQINNNHFAGEIRLDSKQVLFISIPYDKGWKFIDDGEVLETFNVDGGFTGIILNPGYHYIDAWYQPKGFKAGFALSCIGFTGIIGLIYLDLKHNKTEEDN